MTNEHEIKTAIEYLEDKGYGVTMQNIISHLGIKDDTKAYNRVGTILRQMGYKKQRIYICEYFKEN